MAKENTPAPAQDFDARIQSSRTAGVTGSTRKPTQAETTAARTVYMGTKKAGFVTRFGGKAMPDDTRGASRARMNHNEPAGRPDVSTVGEAQESWYEMDYDERKQWTEQAFALGYISDPNDLSQGQSVYNTAVEEASLYFNSRKKTKMTPDDWLTMNAGQGTGMGKKGLSEKLGADGKPLKNRTIVRKSRDVDITRADHARALINSVFQQAYGRAPTPEEVRTLTRTLNGEEQTQQITTTTKYDEYGDPIDEVREVAGGVADPEAFLAEKVDDDPEAAAYQGATTYFGALMQALQSPF